MTRKEMVRTLLRLRDPANEQAVLDEVYAEFQSEYYPGRRQLNRCGHYNCEYHGLCAVVELTNILKMELKYLEDQDDDNVLGSAGKYQRRSDIRPFHPGTLCVEHRAHTGEGSTVLA